MSCRSAKLKKILAIILVQYPLFSGVDPMLPESREMIQVTECYTTC